MRFEQFVQESKPVDRVVFQTLSVCVEQLLQQCRSIFIDSSSQALYQSATHRWTRTEESELLSNNLQSTVKTCVGQTAAARSVHHPLAHERKLGSSARISEEIERDFTLIDSTLHLRTSGLVAWRADTLTLPSPLALESQT